MKKIIGCLLNIFSKFNKRKSVFIAFDLFCKPRAGKLHGDLPQILKESDINRFDYKDSFIQYYLWNKDLENKPLILLIHGWESNAARWEPLIRYLGKNYRIIGFDARGLGASPGRRFNVPEFSELIGTVISKFQPTIIVSHSLGSFALLAQLAKEQYKFISKVVLTGCLDKFGDVLLNYSKMMGYNKKLEDGILRYAESLINMPIDSYASHLFIKSAKAEFLLIHDKRDEIVLLEECEIFHKVFKESNHTIVYTDLYGHSLQGVEVYQTIGNFIS
ncbi:alpha/beta hydrolase [Myroides injenensis]|uniref:alpha/beta hydrolase n=1 Tax=Myroides injenensis TaxID=1183151 RepID=UPI00031ECB4C|nr:alpha/beta hydrolase [Myroides injenensis]